MNKYSIQYHSRTQVALTKLDKQQTLPLPGWVFNFPVEEVKILLFDAIKRTDDVNLHTGLNLITVLKANSLEEAKETSKNFVETILNLVSFSTLTSCSPARLVSTMSIADAETEAYPFLHYAYPFDEQEIIGSLSVINEPSFGELFDAYTKSSHQQRILRALTWLRKGIGEENPVDEFISHWIGLEVIKSILCRNLRYKIKKPRDWDGVKDIFASKLSYQNFDDIKNARRKLFHAGREEDRLDNEFMREIRSYLEPMRKAIIFGIGSIWGLGDNTILTIANKIPQRIKKSHWSVIKGELENITRDFDKLVKNYPTINAEIVNKQFSLNQEGNLTVKFKVTHHFHGPSEAKWKVKAIELWGDKDAGIQTADIEHNT